MIVVSDTSPLTSLLAIDHIQLLPNLYTRIIIPAGVQAELMRVESRRPRILALLSEEWIEIREITNLGLFNKLITQLDKGESEAITLGVEISADLVLMDETKGRSVAKSYGLQVTGLLGVIIEAKKKNLITSVKKVLDELISEAGFWIKRDLYDLILKAAGE